MKISASVYSNKNRNLVELVQELDQFLVDYIHVDCNDDLSVFEDIKKIRSVSKTPIDLHIISSEVSKFYDGIIENNIEFVTFQYENLTEELHIPEEIKSQIGIAIMTNTDIDIFEKYKNSASFILFMTTIPGQSGGTFAEENFQKIREFRSLYPNKKIHVDGGVNDEVSFILRNLGVYSAVSGSYLVKSENIGSSLLKLKSDLKNTNYRISDFMMKRNEIPIVQKDNVSLENILKSINDYKYGFCIVENENNELYGIVTDGDIRRALLSNLNDLNNININMVINNKPKYVKSTMCVHDLLEALKESTNTVVFVPVVDDYNQVQGAVSFQDLIKGEL